MNIGVLLHVTSQVMSFTCMNIGVLLHVGLLVEAFAAVMARERSCVAVNKQVSGQCRRSLQPTHLNSDSTVFH